MKKFFAVILLAAMALTLAACGNQAGEKAAHTEAPAAKEEPAQEPVQEPAEAPAGTADAETLAERAEAVLPDAAELAPFTADELLDMAGIAPEDYSDFVFLQGDGMDGREVLVIRAKDEAAADRLAGQMESYLQRRRDEMENYAPEAYRILSAAKVERKGLLLALISGGNAEAEAAALLAGE